MLTHIRAFARARCASPWATLAAALVRVVVATPPHIVIPPLVGGHMSLNLYAGIVGESGTGKDSAAVAAEAALDVGHLLTCTPGSGEGIAHAYGRRTKDGVERIATSVLFTVAEVDTLTALGGRRGATLLPELRRAYTGDRLGFQYADPDKRLPIDRHSYRMGLLVGIQPGRAGALLDDADGGTPQRFLWASAIDPDAPDDRGDEPEPWLWKLALRVRG